MNSKEYWALREAEQLKHNITEEKEFDKQIKQIYSDMLDSCQREINAFYGKYAAKEGITLAEAKKRVAELDIKAYERKAKRYVADKDFSEKANEEMRLYNATMKINRLEMLKANIGLELISGHNELEKFMEGILQGRTEDELKRQAGILGKTIKNNAAKAHAIVNGSFHNGTFSDRIWLYQDLLRNDLSGLLQSGLIQGKNPRQLARDIKKKFDTSTYNAERLMRTELARVQTEAQKQSFERNGFTEYEFIANGDCCDICKQLDGKHFKVSKMMPGENAPPVHPHCRCSTAAYEDSEDYNAWLEYLDKGGTTAEWEKIKANSLSAKMAAGTTTKNNWDNATARTVTKAEKQELIEYAKSKGINIVDISKFDGDTAILKAEIDTLSKLKADYKLTKERITITVSDSLDDADFASTKNNTITFNAKALRNRAVTEKNIRATKGEFASKYIEDIAAHEFGHIMAAAKGNKGIDISQKAYYNVYGKILEIDDIIKYLDTHISNYAIEYIANRTGTFDKTRYQEIIPEVVAKNNSNANEFTKEFIKLLKEV